MRERDNETAGMKLGLYEGGREGNMFKILVHIHIAEYVSSTQPSLALTSHMAR